MSHRLKICGEIFEEIGVEVCRDLIEVYRDDDLIKQVATRVSSSDFHRFKIAAIKTKCLARRTLSKLVKIDDTAEGESTSDENMSKPFWGFLRNNVTGHNIKLYERQDGSPDSYSVGRGSACDVVIPADQVSSIHCWICREEESIYLHDVSSNGTYVNDSHARLPRGSKSILNHKDEIFLVESKHSKVPAAASFTFNLSAADVQIGSDGEKAETLQEERVTGIEPVKLDGVDPARAAKQAEIEALKKQLDDLKWEEENPECMICGDRFPLQQGIQCALDHFQCVDCFGNGVRHQTGAESRADFLKHGGRIVCALCLPKHTTPFSERFVALSAVYGYGSF